MHELAEIGKFDVQSLLVNAAGFLILFGLLTKFLFGPIQGIIGERERQVQETLAKVEQEREEAQKRKAEYEAHLAKIEEEHRDKVAQFIQEGQQIKEDILRGAREEAEKLLRKAKEQAEREHEAAMASLRDEIVDLVMLTTRNVLQESVDEPVQKKLVQRFLQEIQQVN